MNSVTETYTIVRQHQSNLCHIVLRSDHILQISTMKDVEYGEKEAAEIIKNILEIADNKRYLILVLSGKNSTITVESLKLLANPIGMSYAIAKAYVINSVAQALMTNFYLKVLKPEKPIKFLKTQAEAEEWLKSL